MQANPTYRQILAVAENMRELDRRETFGLRWSDDVPSLAHDFAAMPGHKWIALHDGEPVYVFGLERSDSALFTLWGFGTSDWPKVAYEVSRFAKMILIPSGGLLKGIPGKPIVDCMVLAIKEDAIRWLRWLGAVEDPEHDIPAYGRYADHFQRFIWR